MSYARLRRWQWIHKWSSLISMLFLLMLCITGLPLIFAHEIDEMTIAVEPSPHAYGERASVDGMIRRALERHAEAVPQFLVADTDDPRIWFVRLGTSAASADMSAFEAYDAATGDFLYAYPLDGGFMNVVTRLHVDLFAGLPGTLFLGAMSLVGLLAIVSGVVLYAPYARGMAFGTVRVRRGWRLKWVDLHNVTGMVIAMWLFVVAATGVVNTLATPIFDNWQNTQLADMLAPHRGARLHSAPSADRALASLARAFPDRTLSFMAFPGNEFAGPAHFVAFLSGNTALGARLLIPVMIDAASGEIVESRELPWPVSTLLLAQPLHFGDYGGLPLKLAWALLDLVSILVLITGIVLWVGRFGRIRDDRRGKLAAV